MKANVRGTRNVPGELPVAEWDIVRGCGRELVLGPAFARRLAHAREPERVEVVRAGVVFVAVVHRVRYRVDESALGDDGPVIQRDVLHRLPNHRS